MKLAPDRKKFMEVIQGGGDVNADIEKFCTTFSPFLEENHKFLVNFFVKKILYSFLKGSWNLKACRFDTGSFWLG